MKLTISLYTLFPSISFDNNSFISAGDSSQSTQKHNIKISTKDITEAIDNSTKIQNNFSVSGFMWHAYINSSVFIWHDSSGIYIKFWIGEDSFFYNDSLIFSIVLDKATFNNSMNS